MNACISPDLYEWLVSGIYMNIYDFIDMNTHTHTHTHTHISYIYEKKFMNICICKLEIYSHKLN